MDSHDKAMYEVYIAAANGEPLPDLDVGERWRSTASMMRENPAAGAKFFAQGSSGKSLIAAIESDCRTQYTETRWYQNTNTSRQMQHTHYPEMLWVIDDLLPAGFTLLAAKAKSKKSWLALNLAVAVASDKGKAFGKLDCLHGDVLYLDLESNQRRFKSRLEAMELQGDWPERLHIADVATWMNARGDDAINQLEEWMTEKPDTKLIVVDVFFNIRPARKKGSDPYEEDTRITQAISQFAGHHNVAVLAIHHSRKQKSPDDIFEEIFGTTGISGGVDNMLMLTKDTVDGKKHTTLHVRGRDVIDDTPRAMTWDDITCQWIIEGDAATINASTKDKAVLDLLARQREGMHYKQIAEALGVNVNTMKRRLRSLVHKELLASNDGVYIIRKKKREERELGCDSIDLSDLSDPTDLADLSDPALQSTVLDHSVHSRITQIDLRVIQDNPALQSNKSSLASRLDHSDHSDHSDSHVVVNGHTFTVETRTLRRGFGWPQYAATLEGATAHGGWSETVEDAIEKAARCAGIVLDTEADSTRSAGCGEAGASWCAPRAPSQLPLIQAGFSSRFNWIERPRSQQQRRVRGPRLGVTQQAFWHDITPSWLDEIADFNLDFPTCDEILASIATIPDAAWDVEDDDDVEPPTPTYLSAHIVRPMVMTAAA